MKKILFYFIFVVVLTFVMPILFTKKFKTEDVVSEKIIEDFDYGEYSNLKLLHSTGEIEEINLDTYLQGVVASEMPASFELEALKAQAIVARTYTIYQIKNGDKHENADICDNASCCQAWMTKENRFARWEEDKREIYWGKITKAVNETRGKIIFYEGEPINAVFHSNSGGKTELANNVWSKNFPYFQIVEIGGEENYTSYNSEVVLSKDELIKLMLENNSNFNINYEEPDSIKILEYTEGGRVKKIRIGNTEISGVECRKICGLKSANFKIELNEDTIKFIVTGYGHGVGMSQCGSDVLAKQGKNCTEIIKYYYKNVEIHE